MLNRRTGTSLVSGSSLLASIAVLATSSHSALAADIERFWLPPLGGTFNVATNWDPVGVPDPTDTAIFALGEIFTVNFVAPVNNKLLDVTDGTVTFDLAGFGYGANGVIVGSGDGDQGELEILNGTITVTPLIPPLNVRVGKDAGSDGNLEVAGGGGLTSTDVVIIGDNGVGRMRVSTGGTVVTGRVIVGDEIEAEGTVIVVGPASTWDSSDTVTFGNLGSAMVTARLGATVTTNGIFAADDPGSSAVVNVDGELGSTWTDSGTVNFGNAGVAELNIFAGGGVTWNGISRLGDDLAAGGTVSITGAGSTLVVGAEIFVGNLGTGAIDLSLGGALETARVKLGDESGSLGTITMQSGSTWVDTVDIFVGNFGVGILNVSGGSTVDGATGTLGDDPGSNGTAVIDGAGSSWDSTSTLRIGDLGTGALTVSGGATAGATSITLGAQAGGAGTATVDGLGSTLTASGLLQVGAGGAGLLRVVDGGRVDAQADYTQTGDLEIVLGPDSADMILVPGTATIGGTLDVSLVDGYTPAGGSSVTIIQGGIVSGTFASVTTAPGLEVTVEPTRVIVTATGITCPADIDGDGAVGFGDLLRILGSWGPCGVCPEDLDADGNVGFGDVLIVLSSWGPCP